MILLIGGQKGGTGKSTIATNIATMRVTLGKDVLLYDIDPQKTSTFWASRRDENNILPRIPSCQKILDIRTANPGIVTRNELKAFSSKYEDIIIDAGGAVSEVLKAAMTIADSMIIPLMPSSFDMWTLGTIDSLVQEVKLTNPKININILYNKISPHPQTAKHEIKESNEILNNFEHIKCLTQNMVYRVSIRRSQSEGLSIIEYNPVDKKAITEINKIYEEVFNE